MERLDLAVIESRWWTNSNDSVRGVFDMLAGILVGNPFGYHYEMFNNTESVKEMIPRIARTTDIHHIYIAAHGDTQSIHGAGDAKISRTVIANLLNEVDARQIFGVFFGSCEFGSNVDMLMERTSATWLAGYLEEVDWLHASAMDVFFWHAYYLSGVHRAKRKADRSDNMLALLTALWIRVPYLFKELGFRVSLARGNDYFTFPDDFFDEHDDPEREYRDAFSLVLDYINDGEPGAWPSADDLVA
ncbi:MAG: hypothetical protein OXQ89_13005 [Rhodospirillaceae bacterium]|nr:hypothetical protein [Rhodospirillaceae bacterium]